MSKISALVFPYRDYYFQEKYGCIVRDLHIIQALSENDNVDELIVVNRPVSIYERFLSKNRCTNPVNSKIKYYDTTSFDLLGPLKKRKWTYYCYNNYLNSIKKFFTNNTKCENRKLLLDFTPLSSIEVDVFDGFYKWYDLIDNFTKHNRFDEEERRLVSHKYSKLNKYDLVTGVSDGALKQVSDFHAKKILLPNGLVSRKTFESCSNPIFDFGFIGFVTNKFSFEFIKELKEKFPNSKIVIYGESFDQKHSKLLSKYATLKGSFRQIDLPEIMNTFKIGLIPYKKDSLHDESPLKLYQYVQFSKAIVTTVPYDDLSHSNIVFAPNESYIDTFIFNKISELLSNKVEYSSDILEKHFWDYKIQKVINLIKE